MSSAAKFELNPINSFYVNGWKLLELEQLERLHSDIPPAAPWLPILLIHIGSQVKTRQSQSYKFETFAKN